MNHKVDSPCQVFLNSHESNDLCAISHSPKRGCRCPWIPFSMRCSCGKTGESYALIWRKSAQHVLNEQLLLGEGDV